MKNNVKMIDKSQNSLIYFQLGIIAIMITTLFVLEMNFKVNTYTDSAKIDKDFLEENVFVYNPKAEIQKEVVKEKTKVVVKNAISKNATVFKETKKEVKDDFVKETKTAEDESNKKDESNAKDTDEGNKKELETENNNVIKDGFSVEYLPRFAACANVSKEQQQACFEEQLQKEVAKNLVYPKEDIDNNKEGIVYLSFVIDENGHFTQITSVQNNRSSNQMKLAAEKALKKLPKIVPAKIGTKAVKIRYTVPVKFKIAK